MRASGSPRRCGASARASHGGPRSRRAFRLAGSAGGCVSLRDSPISARASNAKPARGQRSRRMDAARQRRRAPRHDPLSAWRRLLHRVAEDPSGRHLASCGCDRPCGVRRRLSSSARASVPGRTRGCDRVLSKPAPPGPSSSRATPPAPGLRSRPHSAARQHQIAAPAALVLFSPWTDLSPAAIPTTRRATPCCAPTGCGLAPPATLRASPRRAARLTAPWRPRGLPPTLIQAGSDELLYGQALRTYEALRAAGCDVHCEIIPNRWHAFQLLAGSLPSADAAVARAGQFARNAAPPL